MLMFFTSPRKGIVSMPRNVIYQTLGVSNIQNFEQKRQTHQPRQNKIFSNPLSATSNKNQPLISVERFHQCLLSLRDPDNFVIWSTQIQQTRQLFIEPYLATHVTIVGETWGGVSCGCRWHRKWQQQWQRVAEQWELHPRRAHRKGAPG